MKKILIIIFLMLVCCEEEPDNCEPESSRCLEEKDNGKIIEIVQVCNADRNWEEALNCTEIDWRCCAVDGGMICLPGDECN